MTVDRAADRPPWRPGSLGRLRAVARMILLGAVGDRGEERLHAAYHDVLRRTGRFGPPEDQATIAVLGAAAARSRTIIDVGANVGRYAWLLRQRARPETRLYALEPHPGAARLLRNTLRRLPDCAVLELAASDRDGSAGLRVPNGAFGSSVSALAWVEPPHETISEELIGINLRRLDSLVEDGTMKVVGPILLKIDVEGGEGHVLRGAAQLLRRHRPVIYFECQVESLARQGETPDGIWDQLEGAGYHVLANRAGTFVPMSGVDGEVVNYLAVPDLTGADRQGPLERASIEARLDTWAARTAEA